jgi:hypothetical protein
MEFFMAKFITGKELEDKITDIIWNAEVKWSGLVGLN